MPENTEFDELAANPYRSRAGFWKTALLVEVVDQAATTAIVTPFGEQVMLGSFYVVGDGAGSYGSAKMEFERSHRRVRGHEWMKEAVVLAYEATERTLVRTILASGHVETVVVARPGQWLVRQPEGEVVVMSSQDFEIRYEPTIESIDGE